MKLSVKQFNSINQFDQKSWDALNINKNPFLNYHFLNALESSASVSAETGWEIAHLGWFDQEGILQAAMPQYYKTHSYGEYMFDWAWAEGITKAGIPYYPKVVSAIPFTPVSGQRFMLSEELDLAQPNLRVELLSQHLTDINSGRPTDHQLSNFQCLFITEDDTENWRNAGAMIRQGYQFSWYNHDYKCFDDFLADLRSSPRKKIKKERRSLLATDITFKRLENTEIDDELWEFFIVCYQQTYLKRSGHTGYLNHEFFNKLRDTMAENLLIICAYRNEQPLACSLFIKGNNTLYGRYWGAVELVDSMHFECCYYQAIEYCIEQGIECFQPGTQGDYKRRRGFIPEPVFGAYYFADVNLQQPIQEYLDQETKQLEHQFTHWKQTTPYK